MKGAFFGKKNFDIIKMHGTTIKKIFVFLCWSERTFNLPDIW